MRGLNYTEKDDFKLDVIISKLAVMFKHFAVHCIRYALFIHFCVYQ